LREELRRKESHIAAELEESKPTIFIASNVTKNRTCEHQDQDSREYSKKRACGLIGLVSEQQTSPRGGGGGGGKNPKDAPPGCMKHERRGEERRGMSALDALRRNL